MRKLSAIIGSAAVILVVAAATAEVGQ